MNKKTENENKTKENIKESKDANINKSNTIENSQNNEKQELLDIKNDYVFKCYGEKRRRRNCKNG